MFKHKLFIKSFFLLLLLFISLETAAQAGIFFQAIARDINNNPAKSRKLYIQSNIIQSSPSGNNVLIEEHQTNTDDFGVFSIMVGNGRRIGGDASNLSTIDWSKGPYYLNLKIAITPVKLSITWDYTKDLVDLGTTIFGTVPIALYSANAAKIDDKLNIVDSSKMLEPYAKVKTVQLLSSAIDAKLAANDTTLMLSSYSRITYVDSALSTKFNNSDTIKYTKLTYTDSALLTKMNLFDTSGFTKQIFLDSALSTRLLLTDTIKYTKQIYTDSALLTKLSLTGNAFSSTLADNITATKNTTITSLANLNTVGTITTGVWSSTIIDVAHGGTGLTNAGLSGQVLTTSAAGTLTWTNMSDFMGAHYIGESFGGGIVFYINDNGKHGLIAATSDQSRGIRWYGGSNTNTRARADGVGAGLKNTAIIIANQGAVDGNAFAATVCNEYSVTVDGVKYGDWYLPSKYELNLLYLQKSVVGGFANFNYWSSTEIANFAAWTQLFNNGYQVNYDKRTTVYVRAIRAF